ncbi:oligoribonuclease [Legionella saoudiensis]|uniref:oligoribonuclease n=1 Tax=Legionella saoudiensis TaxID=1750561 RepID=UPI0007310346|nr:oligoribonuclease [Legionella saoudiensis]
MKNNHNLIWIDLEMTGLDPEENRIIEIATIVTDPHLNIIGEGPVYAVSQPKALLDAMDSWNTRQHGQSGLVKRVLESSVNEKQAEQDTINFLKQFVDKGKSPMCGNSVCQDRRFLYKYMPELAAFFHYRNLDVSTLKELAIRWKPELLNGFNKQSKHLALDDIKDSIAELVYYRQHFINLPEVTQ